MKEDNRIQKILEILSEYAQLNFAKSIPGSGSGDQLDEISLKLNDMARELQEWKNKHEQKWSMTQTTRKKEDAIQLTESNYRELFDKGNDAVYVQEMETGKILDVNQKASEITGYSKNELLNSNPQEFITDNPYYSLQKSIEYIQKAAAGNQQLFEWLGKKKDGSNTWFEVNLKKATIAGKGRILAFFREINDLKTCEEKILELNEELEQKVTERTTQLENHVQLLKESKEEFQKAFQASDAAIALTRLSDSTYRDVNEAFIKLTGYSREELIGHTSMELGLTVNVQRRDEILQQIREHGSAKHLDIKIRNKGGQIVEVLSSIETILLNGKKYAINIIYDITERKKAEEKLQKSNELFSRLFEENPVSIAISHLSDSKILNINASFLQFFGFSKKEDLIGKKFTDLNVWVHPEQRDEMIMKVKEQGKVQNLERQIRTQRGEIKWAASSFHVVEINSELCLIAVTLDIDARMKAEEQLQTTNSELESFTYTVSHDLRAPLRALNGYAFLLNQEHSQQLDKEGKRLVESIRSNATRMGTLIDDLLEFSRLGRKEIQKNVIDMSRLVEDALNEINKSMTHHATINVSKLGTVKGDYSLLRQAMFNLIFNAIKYSAKKESPVVEIASEKKEGQVIFLVRDNGAGFDMRYANKLFGVFQRLHSREEFEGTGVGLAIVHRIITKHGGSVWAQGKVNEGATFYFSLADN